MAANVDTAHRLAPARPGTLRLRIQSALVLAPAALVAVWLGGPFLSALTVLAGSLMGWEWTRLCGHGRVGSRGAAIIAVIIAAILCGAFGAPLLALALLGGGALLIGALGRHSGEPVLAVFGLLWIGLPCTALLWLAQDVAAGRTTVLWILAVVWATDIGAYAAGRVLGGPRLAPRLSPNKTWAGLIGGILCAAAAGTATALVLGLPVGPPLPLVSGFLAIVAQSGDLAESMAKRHFGVKDSSGLIPGHGGLLDRLDGMLTVIPAVAFLSLLGGGSVVTWR